MFFLIKDLLLKKPAAEAGKFLLMHSLVPFHVIEENKDNKHGKNETKSI